MTWLFVGLLVFVAACSSGQGPPDMGIPIETPWDGKCLGRSGDTERLMVWNHRPYICKDHGKRGWWFEQAAVDDLDPDRKVDGVVRPDGTIRVF